MGKPCSVTFNDLNGLRHTVELEAETVYEAAVLALEAFRKSSFGEVLPGAVFKLQVSVREPVVSHEVSLHKLREWVERSAKSPAETIRRKRLKAILDGIAPKPS